MDNLHRTLRWCQVGAAVSAIAALVFYSHMDLTSVVTHVLPVSLTVLTVLGVGPPIVGNMVGRAVRDEMQTVRAQMRKDVRRELAAAAQANAQDVLLAREEGVRDGVLRTRLGRVAGDPPTPRPRFQVVDE